MFEVIYFLVICMLAAILYFVPTWVAISRGAKNACGILLLNLFLGWSLLGWVIALIWSVCAECEVKEVEQKMNLFGGGSRGWGEE
jgi:hypothetical protein